MRLNLIKSLLEHELEATRTQTGDSTPIMIWGPPGVGKSQVVAQIARDKKIALIDIRLSQLEPSDLRGLPFRSEQGGVEWAIPKMLPNSKRHGNNGILFLDEINAAPPSVSAAAYQLILDRAVGQYRVPDGWVIFAAGNRQGDRGVAYVMPAPLSNRFCHYELNANLDDWVLWALQHGIDERLIGFLRFRPELLFEYDAEINPMAFPTPRTWEFADRALKKFASSEKLMAAALEAAVGPAAGIEFMAYLENLEKLPDIDSILNGEKVEVPDEVDLQYAVAAALTRRAKMFTEDEAKPKLENILAFASQFPQREMGVMLVSDLHRILDDKLFKLENFKPWAELTVDLLTE